MSSEEQNLRSLAHALGNKYAFLDGVVKQIRKRVIVEGTHEVDVENLVAVLEKQALALKAYAFLARGAEGPYEQVMDQLFAVGPVYFKLKEVE